MPRASRGPVVRVSQPCTAHVRAVSETSYYTTEFPGDTWTLGGRGPWASTWVQTPAEPRPSLPTLDREPFFQFPSGYVHGATESSGHDFGTSIARVAREPMPAPTLGAGDKLTQDGPETEPSCALEPLETCRVLVQSDLATYAQVHMCRRYSSEIFKVTGLQNTMGRLLSMYQTLAMYEKEHSVNLDGPTKGSTTCVRWKRVDLIPDLQWIAYNQYQAVKHPQRPRRATGQFDGLVRTTRSCVRFLRRNVHVYGPHAPPLVVHPTKEAGCSQ